MKLNFKISEFNISGKPIPEDVADKLLKWHILPMQRVRDKFRSAIWASQESGYRPVSWEKSHGRSGNSQHTFKTKGAVDWTFSDFTNRKQKLIQLIIEQTSYTRIAVYSSFIHCDYKMTSSGRRELFSSDRHSKWHFERFI